MIVPCVFSATKAVYPDERNLQPMPEGVKPSPEINMNYNQTQEIKKILDKQGEILKDNKNNNTKVGAVLSKGEFLLKGILFFAIAILFLLFFINVIIKIRKNEKVSKFGK